MAIIKALALSSILHGEHNLTKHQPIDLPQGTYKDLEKAGHVEEFDEKKYKALEKEREERAERNIVNIHLAEGHDPLNGGGVETRNAGNTRQHNKNQQKHQNQPRGNGGNANK